MKTLQITDGQHALLTSILENEEEAAQDVVTDDGMNSPDTPRHEDSLRYLRAVTELATATSRAGTSPEHRGFGISFNEAEGIHEVYDLTDASGGPESLGGAPDLQEAKNLIDDLIEDTDSLPEDASR